MPDKKVKQYWRDKIQTGNDICMNCGEPIDFENEIALIATRTKIDINTSDEAKEELEKFFFCPTCGTDIDRMHKLGMKTFLGFLNGPSRELDSMVDEDAEPERRN
jgi:RNA polymerase-binding transcription factor DksA